MRQITGYLAFRTSGPGLVPIDREVGAWLGEHGVREGLLTLLCQHTSASLTIQENADPDVALDLQDALGRLAPHGGRERYRHASEGPDDMAGHIRTVLSGVHLAIPVIDGRLALGTWQGLWLWEHRDRPRERRVALHLLAD
ncbi:MAG TPA: secondary thiamine-phosphate synthase enzyme YjbQ [Thermohalobaculum sp.]|nr:secondary thiamine-phosphate synthase enzyme YjbQ [Thermohalobaculum sp.]